MKSVWQKLPDELKVLARSAQRGFMKITVEYAVLKITEWMKQIISRNIIS